MRASVVVVATLWAVTGAAAQLHAQEVNTLLAGEVEQGWALLFDGATLNGWEQRGDAEWVVENAAITAVTASGRGHLVTEGSFGNFELRAEFWVDDTANSGIFFRVPETGDITQSNSFEVNIFDAHAEWPTGSINEFQRIASTPNTVGQWNVVTIRADGDHMVVTLNGDQTVDVRASRLESGPISLQYNGAGVIRFRNIRVRPL